MPNLSLNLVDTGKASPGRDIDSRIPAGEIGPKADSIVTSFEEVVARSPDACALRWVGGSWSYAELNARANRLAHFLIRAGVQAETPVGVFAWRSPETLMAFLAILKAGGAYVPLDPFYPPDRIEHYVEDAVIQMVLADPNEISKLPSLDAQVVPLQENPAQDQPETNPDRSTGPASLAHILFTSGSTGRPKGVLIEHRGILRLTRNIDYAEINSQDVFLQYAPLSFDASTFEIWGAWLNGATLAVPPSGHRSLHDLAADLQAFQATTIWLTAGLFQAMVEQELKSLAGVRQLLTGGDVVSPAHAERFLQKYPDCGLINGYGPTENTVFTSCHRIRLENPMPARLSIGRPIKGTEVTIVDGELRPVTPGEIGELVLTGEGVARGYLNQPELTEQSFVQVANSSGAKVRGYRSGDLGRYNTDGTLDFCGRRDDQVKINGIRIEPGEIKAILQSHPKVSGAEVLVVENAGQKRLEIFAVLRPGAALEESVLRGFLRNKFPGNWLPPFVRIISQLPLNPNGKVDRRALLENVVSTPGMWDPGIEDKPDDFLEKAIWSIWRDMLPGTRIGRHDRFSDLGGDSLSAMRMMGRVEAMVGRTIGLRPLLEGGTIADIAAAARETGPVSPPPLMICTQAGGGKTPFFFAHGDYIFGGLYCRRIVHGLDAEQPFYAIAPHGTFGGDLPSRFGEIAESLVQMIRSIQPKGPYQLGGFCNGALAMYEAAQQLIRAGETVKALVLFDPPDLSLFILRRKLSRLGRLLHLPEHPGRNSYQRIAESIEIWRSYGVLRFLSDLWNRSIQWTLKILKHLFDFQKTAPAPAPPNLDVHYREVMAQYEPQAYRGQSVWIILRKEESDRYPRQISYWSGFIPDARFEVIHGTHLELKSSMGEITDIIKAALSKSA